MKTNKINEIASFIEANFSEEEQETMTVKQMFDAVKMQITYQEKYEQEDENLLTCFKCGDKMREADGKIWHHGDQDDMICPDCAEATKHTDTAYAGTYVGGQK